MEAAVQTQESTDYILVTDNQVLNAYCKQWSAEQIIAMDTEFIRTSTFYPKMGLIQICDGQQNYLIDPLSIDDWDAFKALMTNQLLLKIFHSCSEDLLVFIAFLGIIPQPIFDTQIASAFLNEGFAISYQNLVKQRKGFEIPKGETRSDWLQRPLTEKQLKYAALDVDYLPEIYKWQAKQLEKTGKLSWCQEECQRLVEAYERESKADFRDYYLSISSAWHLSNRELASLQDLAAWREERARQRNKPRNWIIKDKELVLIAKASPRNAQQLAAIPNIHSSFINYEGDAVLNLLEKSDNYNEDELPATLPRPLSTGQKNKLRKAQAYAEEKSEKLIIAKELLSRKRSLIALFHNIIKAQKNGQNKQFNPSELDIPEELTGWRKSQVLMGLIEILQ